MPAHVTVVPGKKKNWLNYVAILLKLSSKSSDNACASGEGDLRFKSWTGQIEHSVENGWPALRHFFKRSCVALWCNDAEMASQTRYTLRRRAMSIMKDLILILLGSQDIKKILFSILDTATFANWKVYVSKLLGKDLLDKLGVFGLITMRNWGSTVESLDFRPWSEITEVTEGSEV